MTLKKLIVSLETSERSYQSINFSNGKLSKYYRIDDYLNDHQRNKEKITI